MYCMSSVLISQNNHISAAGSSDMSEVGKRLKNPSNTDSVAGGGNSSKLTGIDRLAKKI